MVCRFDKPWWRPAGRIVKPVVVAYLLVLLAMMLLESRLVYPVPPLSWGNWNPAGFEHEQVYFQSADGTKLHGWFVPHPNPKHAIVYCHGNGEHIAMNAELAVHLRDKLRASVFLFDYRGYGHSEGTPNEAGCVADGSAAQHWLAERMSIRPDDVVLMGRSLGGGVAVALAASNGARALVLENTFSSMTDAAAAHYPWLPVRWTMDNRFDAVSQIRDYRGPLFQSHGTEDEIVPIDQGRRLFDAAPGKLKHWVEIAGLSHNDPWLNSYYDDLATFLDKLGKSRIGGGS
jgi:fermentation-respiration switch protein FrsA (DUF1100 family)